MIKAKNIVKATSGRLINNKNNNHIFYGISIDSRKIKKGYLFWAIKGERFDGHDFVISALDSGAAGAVIQESNLERICRKLGTRNSIIISVQDTLTALGDLSTWWRKQHKTKVIGITGSSGKTSTKEIIANILSMDRKVLKNPGNYNNLIGLPLTLLNLRDYHDIAVLEMGMNMQGEIKRLTEIADPNIGIITNIGHVHLEGVKDIYGVAKAKSELVQQISPNSVIFINGDNQILLGIAMQFGKKLITFGLNSLNDIKLKKIYYHGIMGTHFTISWEGRDFSLRINVPGKSNVLNAMVAFAVCSYIGISEEQIKKGLLSYKGIKGRFEIIHLKNNMILINDTYNSNPLSLKSSIDSLYKLTKNKKIIIGLGDMLELGNYSKQAHIDAGKIVAKIKPSFFTTIGTYAHYMIYGAKLSGMDKRKLHISTSHDEMSNEIEKRLCKDCVIFLKASRKIALEKVTQQIINKFGKE